MGSPRRKRAFLSKVRTGCLTCKSRKVKCDEARPQCRKCTSTGRVCAGYQQPAPSQPVEQSMSAWLDTDAEKRSFHYFLTHAGHQLGGFFNAPFWSQEVLQAAIGYPSIRHLIVALGAAYETFEHGHTAPLVESASREEDERRFALQQCNHSIAQIRLLSSPISSSTIGDGQSAEAMCCIVTAAILFATFASLQGHMLEAIAHVRSGLRILRDLESHQRLLVGSGGASSPALPFPVPVARLQSLLTSLYAQARAMKNDEALADWGDQDPLVSGIAPVDGFTGLEDAQLYVEALYKNTLAFHQRTELSPPVTQEQAASAMAYQRTLWDALRSSCNALDALVERLAGDSDGKAIAILRAYHHLLELRLATDIFRHDKREIAFDHREGHFVQMLDQCRLVVQGDADGGHSPASQPTFSSGLGVVIPLHMIAARCRNPVVRREAAGLLLGAQRRDGLWDSTRVGNVATTTIELEHRASMAYDGGQTKVPDDARIREVKVLSEDGRSAVLSFVTVGHWKNKQSGYQRTVRW